MPARRADSGFAMLLVFAMAAVIAITLYMAVPQVAFEAQRDKEQTLIDRGEQYKRAIQVFFRKNKRYPGKLEDLENTNGVRFLRHRYVDPMSGKDEWRMIHVGPGGVLIDSVVQKQKDAEKNKKTASVNNFITELQPIGGGTDPNLPPTVAQRRRDNIGLPANSAPGSLPPGSPDPFNPQGNAVGIPVPGDPNGQLYTGAPPTGQPGQPGIGQPFPGQINPQTGAVNPYPQQSVLPPNSQRVTNPGMFGTGQPGFGPQPGFNPLPGQPQTPNGAADVIGRLLTTPRPGGFPGAQQAGAQGAGGLQIGGGLAGVASTVKREGIKVYNERKKYNEWEFIYDYGKDQSNGAGGMTAGPGQPIGQAQPGTSTGTGAQPGTSSQPNTGFQPGVPAQPPPASRDQ